jgi:hypothetical protein
LSRYRNEFKFPINGRYKNGAPRFECGDHWLWLNDDGRWVSNGGNGDYSIEFTYPHTTSSSLPPAGMWELCEGGFEVGWYLERFVKPTPPPTHTHT